MGKNKKIWTGIVMAAVLVLAASGAGAEQVKLNVALAQPVLKADHKQSTYLKVGLTGFAFKSDRERTPVNLAIIIDKSGSMQGEKIRKAREAACMAIDRLGNRDIVSVVAYNHNVQVLVPATKLTDRNAVKAAIRRLEAGGNTALFAGVSKGAAETRKFLDRNRANRVLLLSDGLANVGPSSPVELGRLGSSLIKEGMSVTTIGLGGGYNEDLMSQLAEKSDGNHYFAENATDLARLYKGELGDVLSVCAQEVTVEILCAEGVRPVRVLNRDAEITGQKVMVMLNQIYGAQEKYVMIEVEVPATAANRSRPVATVKVAYANMQTKTTDRLTSSVAARFTKSEALVEKKMNRKVMVNAVEQIATRNNEKAVALRDKGKIKEAKKVLGGNILFLKGYVELDTSGRLQEYSDANGEDMKNLDNDNWKGQRKKMKAWHRYNYSQQSLK